MAVAYLVHWTILLRNCSWLLLPLLLSSSSSRLASLHTGIPSMLRVVLR